MSELRALYQEIILDHNKNPRNFKRLEDANRTVEGYNPLCGDHYTLFLKVEGDIIRDIAFQGSGCAISKASASVMTSIVKGKTKEEAEKLFETFHKLVTGELAGNVSLDELGKLAAFAGVSEFPARVKCASLPWHTMRSALEAKSKTVSTE
jgi:nitrogen fixation NifU-like protein